MQQSPFQSITEPAGLPEFPDWPSFWVPNSKIKCEYPDMKGYVFAGRSGRGRVGAWLGPPEGSSLPAYDIHTDYEKVAPKGILRKVTSLSKLA